MTVATLSIDELGQTIVHESDKYSKRIIAKYGMNPEEVSELSSFLQTELWCELHNKPDLHNIRIVRRLINLRQVDYFRNKGRFDDQIPFCGFYGASEDQYEETPTFDYTFFGSSDINIEDNFVLNQELTSFIETLTERQKQILKLVNEGYGTLEICDMLGVSINTPKNTMKKIRILAIENGLSLEAL